MLVTSLFGALRATLSPALQRVLWRSLGLTILLLLLVWAVLTGLARYAVDSFVLVGQYAWLHAIAAFMAGAGLLIGLGYVLPAVSAVVAGFFLDDAALIVESEDFPSDPPGRALSVSASLAAGLRFGALALAVNLLALMLLFVPGINLVAFFAANTYLLGREYFELAASRFRPRAEAAALRRRHRWLVLAAGALLAGLLLLPIVNFATPIVGIALMVHLHKRIAARDARRLGGSAGPGL